VSAERYLESWKLHPRGEAVAIAARGNAFTFANWEGAVMHHSLTASDPADGNDATHGKTAVRVRLPHWLRDGKRLIAVTDAGGEESFVILHADGSAGPERLPDLDIGRPDTIAVNPKKDQIAFSNHRYELLFFDLNSRELRRIDRGSAFPSRVQLVTERRMLVYSVS
jgi:tricorn protease